MIFAVDGYKVGHPFQYPKGTEFVYSNMTPRASRIPGIRGVRVVGVQMVMQDLVNDWDTQFFSQPKDAICFAYQDLMFRYLGMTIDITHIAALHDLGYLPVKVKALPEGSFCPLRVPFLTITNTHADFGWVTNMLETQLSAELWKPVTVATIAAEYRRVFAQYARETTGEGEDLSFLEWQGHDFSMRGMSGVLDATKCGVAHLTQFSGTDSVPAVIAASNYYGPLGKCFGGSIPATEHSVMCAGQDDRTTLRRLITEVYPSGPVSVVADTWDFWAFVTEVVPSLYPEIMSRDGKLVIRPDSGDPVKILCGDPDAVDSAERKGLVEVLWDIFGGRTTTAGYKLLDPHIGVIYGDSITLERQAQILEGLKQKGFASFNVVLGIGSYTYQYITRDTFGLAMKATWAQIAGQPVDLYKTPKTDDGTKHSARGLLRVDRLADTGELKLREQVSFLEEQGGELRTVLEDGMLMNALTFPEVRDNARR